MACARDGTPDQDYSARVEGSFAAFASVLLGVALAGAAAGPTPANATTGSGSDPQHDGPLPRLIVAVPDAGTLIDSSALKALVTRLHVADPAATPTVMLADTGPQAIGPFRITRESSAPADEAGELRIDVDAGSALVTPLRRPPSDEPQSVTVVEVLGDATGIVAHRTGRLVLTPDELRVPIWALPDDGADAVALDGGWWTLGPSQVAVPVAAAAPGETAFGETDVLRARLSDTPVSDMRRLVDVSVGEVTDDGTPVIALSFRRPYQRTLLNASEPRRTWTDAKGLSAHVGLYRQSDLSEIWVAGTLLHPVRRLAACTGALAVAYSTLGDTTIRATSAWRWQGFAFLPLPELSGRGTPTCIDIDRDGRSEATITGRS